ncbi:30S ribosomal protein S15 [Candidatus Parcubacteria bacterium A4]|nr:MAG: 30S ribosomal protein S15 [Candidatus Parcubacteria bacterium A4]
MLKGEEKTKIIKANKINDNDTGSPEVQIALLSKEIKKLLSHLEKHKQDIHSKRGLLKMVSKRRVLLKRLKEKDEKRHANVVKKMES